MPALPHASVASALIFDHRLAGRFANRYSALVRWSGVLVCVLASTSLCSGGNWTGEYADENFLDGQAAFQLSIEQSGNAIQVSFNAAYADAHGAAPDGEGPAKIVNNTLEFKWEDSFKNSGTGRIRRAGEDIVVSMKTTRVVDSRCLVFYGQNMRLKRVK